MSERVFLVRENLRRRTRPFVDESSSLTVTDDTEVLPLASVVDSPTEAKSVVFCSCVTISLWLSSDWPSSPGERILVTVVLVMVVRVDTALLSVVDTTGTTGSPDVVDGTLAILISVESTVVVVVVEVVVTCVMMVLTGSVAPPLPFSSAKSSLRLDSSAEGIGEGAILMILTPRLGLVSVHSKDDVLL